MPSTSRRGRESWSVTLDPTHAPPLARGPLAALLLTGCTGGHTTATLGGELASTPVDSTAAVTLAAIPGAQRSVSRGFRDGDAGTVTVDPTIYDPISGEATFHLTATTMDISAQVSGCEPYLKGYPLRIHAGTSCTERDRRADQADAGAESPRLLQRHVGDRRSVLLASRYRRPPVDAWRTREHEHPRTRARDSRPRLRRPPRLRSDPDVAREPARCGQRADRPPDLSATSRATARSRRSIPMPRRLPRSPGARGLRDRALRSFADASARVPTTSAV